MIIKKYQNYLLRMCIITKRNNILHPLINTISIGTITLFCLYNSFNILFWHLTGLNIGNILSSNIIFYYQGLILLFVVINFYLIGYKNKYLSLIQDRFKNENINENKAGENKAMLFFFISLVSTILIPFLIFIHKPSKMF